MSSKRDFITKSLPKINLSGGALEVGREHGADMRREIDHNVDLYLRRFKNETQLSPEQVAERSSKYLAVIERYDPYYAAAMRGIAEGSGQDLIDITALNVRYELMYSQFSKIGAKVVESVDGCTAFAATPESVDNGHLLMAQNWDWIPEVEGVLMKVRGRSGSPDVLCFTEAGVVGGKIGLNSRGLGLLINGLVSDKDDWSKLGKPFHVRCWEILISRRIEDAVKIVSEGERSCSANFILGQQLPGSKQAVLVNLESSPDGVNKILPNNVGVVAHTNHFCDPAAAGVKQVIDDEWRSTLTRYDRISHLLEDWTGRGERMSVAVAQRMLRDHDGRPDSVCRHPNQELPLDERYKSVVSVAMDLHDRTLWITSGSPCEQEYEAHTF